MYAFCIIVLQEIAASQPAPAHNKSDVAEALECGSAQAQVYFHCTEICGWSEAALCSGLVSAVPEAFSPEADDGAAVVGTGCAV